MRSIAHGQRLDLASLHHQIRISGRGVRAFAQLAPFLLPLGADDKLHPAFPPIHVGDSRPGFGFVPGQGVDIDLGRVPAEISRLQLVLYVVGGPSRAVRIDHVEEIETLVGDVGRFVLDTRQGPHTALILIEFYRRGAGWRLAAAGQGFTTGIPGIMRSYGIELQMPEAESDPHDDADHDGRRQRPPPGSGGATGSGFAISSRLVLTNHHVIEYARSISVTGENPAGINSPAAVIASDPVNDIALLSINHDAAAIAAFRADHDVELGDDVVVAGFPLQGLLGSGPQISAGNISALTGIHGNAALLQFNSPIGSGSSGGPMLDNGGRVIGLVTSVLRQPQADASIAQNMNFGVKASLMRSFLHACSVKPLIGDSRPISRAEIARNARSFLYRITVEY